MKYLTLGLLFLSTTTMYAQKWKLNFESGLNIARLIPASGSTPASGSFRYGYTKPKVYLAPELQLKLNERFDVGIGYQYINATLGTTHTGVGSRESSYDNVDLHSVALSMNAHRAVFHNNLQVGAFVKAGVAYANMVGYGMAGNSGGVPGNSTVATGSSMERTSGFEVMEDAWVPMMTLGFSCGPNSKGWLSDRLAFNWAATIIFDNPYNDFTSYDYTITQGSTVENGTIKYQGMPFIVQFGIRYRITSFGGKA